MTTPLPDPEAVRLAIRRRFLKFGPSADQAMVIVRTVLEDRDAELDKRAAEIELLQSRLAALEDAP